MKLQRTVMLYMFLWPLTVVLAALGWALAHLWLLESEALSNPRFAQRLERLQQTYKTDDWANLNEETEEAVLAVVRPVLEQVDYTRVRIVVSLVVFGFVGLLAGFFTGDPRWAGALPVMTVPFECNPAVLPGPATPAPAFGEQVLLFALQIVVVYLGAVLGMRLRALRRGGSAD